MLSRFQPRPGSIASKAPTSTPSFSGELLSTPQQKHDEPALDLIVKRASLAPDSANFRLHHAVTPAMSESLCDHGSRHSSGTFSKVMFGETSKLAFEILHRSSALLEALMYVWSGFSVLQIPRKSGRVKVCGDQARPVLRQAFRSAHAVGFYTSLHENVR